MFFPPKLKASFCLTLITESKIFLALRNYLYIYRRKQRLRFIGNHRDHDLAVSGNGYGASVAQIDVQVDASAARIEQLEKQLAEQAGSSVARILELEQQLKAAKAVASDANGDKLIDLLSQLVEHSKETNARLKEIEKSRCNCVIAA